jgi:hypothetical protein
VIFRESGSDLAASVADSLLSLRHHRVCASSDAVEIESLACARAEVKFADALLCIRASKNAI